jgi:CPA2 family monovalent cation:H+ antiporter-2
VRFRAPLHPGDEICVIGTDAQVKEFKTYLQHNIRTENTLQQLELARRTDREKYQRITY